MVSGILSFSMLPGTKLKTAWMGDAQKTMEAFLDLVVQYHKDLGAGDNTPVAEAVDALEKLQNNLSKFYGDGRNGRI